jgi:hypothetical protein
MKKFLALILAIVTVSTLLVACATNPEKPDETTPAPDPEATILKLILRISQTTLLLTWDRLHR